MTALIFLIGAWVGATFATIFMAMVQYGARDDASRECETRRLSDRDKTSFHIREL